MADSPAHLPAAPRPVWVLRICPGPHCRVPGVVALRKLLKALARTYALECIDAHEAPAAAPAHPPERVENPSGGDR